MPVASAQVKSCLLLAGLYADGQTCVRELAPTRDHTERMLTGFSYPVVRAGDTVCIRSGGKLVARDIDVPSDISSAAFFMVGAAIGEGADITLKHVGVNPTRTGVIEILRLMGADIEVLNPREIGGGGRGHTHPIESPQRHRHSGRAGTVSDRRVSSSICRCGLR